MSRPEVWARLKEEELADHVDGMSEGELGEFAYDFQNHAHDGQLPPEGDWYIWLVMAGRGFGKTRAGSEWVRSIADNDPQARIALVAASLGEARAVMVEGESGIIACCAPDKRPTFEPSLRRISWPNGAMATLYSAAEPEALRGPQHSHAWCDEVAKWSNSHERATRSWDNLLLGLRLGRDQRVMATTTPRAVPLLRRLLDEKRTQGLVLTSGTTRDNAANLPTKFLAAMDAEFGNSALGLQELDGMLLDDIEGALWNRALIERCRNDALGDPPLRIVIGVDPPASSRGDECGIMVCGLGAGGVAQVLADCSVEKPTPERWARAVAQAAQVWNADRVVAEANQGGDMVASVLRAADLALPLKLVHASRGKAARAEPVAALYESGRVVHADMFALLEDQLCGLMAGGTYEGPGNSPDRADALVWALSELMLGKNARPRIRNI
ncbi:DNA-packaging protein [Qipengyuania aquimaris]|uniref:DNA-packaging protein n=1 Tax=Qipengyuania aquimaris TaxID=255984 RepID=UPI001CD6747C|nr:terminase family protein [Qipengyuania aquimaris]MCA0903620.1 terminase family protein [Qipengyuania aquimaris]